MNRARASSHRVGSERTKHAGPGDRPACRGLAGGGIDARLQRRPTPPGPCARTPLEVSFTADSRPYDGTTDAELNRMLLNPADIGHQSDDVTCARRPGGIGDFASKDVANGITVSADASDFDSRARRLPYTTSTPSTRPRPDITAADVEHARLCRSRSPIRRQRRIAPIDSCTVNRRCRRRRRYL